MNTNHDEDARPPRLPWPVFEETVAEWRQERSCPGDDALALYCEGRATRWQQLRVWGHVQRCALCRADLATLQEAFAVAATAAPAPPAVQQWQGWHRVWGPVLAAGLLLSLAFNVWLGVQLFGKRGEADTSARLRLAFVDSVPERDLRTRLLNLQATIIAGPSLEGVYTVQVALQHLFSPERSGEAPYPSDPAAQMRVILKELRADPAVRLAEPVP